MVSISNTLSLSIPDCICLPYHTLRPNGKFLATTPGRFLLGREIMMLMGMPIHELTLNSSSESVPCFIY